MQVIPIDATYFWTNGKGLWTNHNNPVMITGFSLIPNKYDEYGELRIYFNSKHYSVDNVGLIYTDPAFLRHTKNFLKSIDISTENFDYSEHGMQGDDYVSFDAGPETVSDFLVKFKF